MALPPAFLDELRARTPLSGLIGRKVKLARSGRQWKGCCPFHGEKSASFYVYEDHFHCFGCGVHGDAISFVMQSQGASFPEAVEQLAGEAGMDVPKPTPQAAEAERRRLDLNDVLEAAAASYQRRLFLPEGAPALDYLRGRGLRDETIRRFGLGWSGEGRGALAAELAREEVGMPMLVEAGLMRPGVDGRPASEMFFNRVMFPIRDRRGRVISFGGRTLGDGQPKYVNGPETAVYSKRRTLFALDLAREAARTGAPVAVVEGYMDVIALHQAGFGGAVAPLGTALTAEQMEELWRLSPTPIVCFDGDGAGSRAAAKAAEMVLPLLTAERTLRLAKLPSGEDPDTLIRRGGASAFQDVLDGARHLSDTLFDLAGEGQDLRVVEDRGRVGKRLDGFADLIADKGLGWEYRRGFRDRLRTSAYAARPRSSKFGAPLGANRPPPAFNRPAVSPEGAESERGRTLVAILLRHPDLLHDVEEAFGELDLPAGLARLREAILHWGVAAEVLDSAGLMSHLSEAGLEAETSQALASDLFPLPACASAVAMPAEAEAGWWHIFGLMHRERLEEEVASAMHDLARNADEAAQRRLIALCTARNALREGEHGVETDR